MSKVEFGERLAESTDNFSDQSLNHQSQGKIQAKGNFDIDIAIIGAGVHALTLTMHLLQKRQDVRKKILQQFPIKPATEELPKRGEINATMMKPIQSIFISNSINSHSNC
jgi:hypothetical protein